jgi:ribonuclease E
MGLIVRTAGLSAPRPRSSATSTISPACGDEIRENTLKSAAPALVYQDSDLVKAGDPRHLQSGYRGRSTSKGDEGYRHARGFMKL